MKILTIAFILILSQLSFAQETPGFELKILNDFNHQKISFGGSSKTFLSNRTLIGAQAGEGNHFFSIMYGQEYIQGFDANDSLRLGYVYLLIPTFRFKLFANIGHDVYFYQNTNKLDSTLVSTMTLVPQMHYFFQAKSSLFLGAVAQQPSEMKVSGMAGYVPVEAKRGFGYTLGVNHTIELSQKMYLEINLSYLQVHRATQSVKNQVNEQLHGLLSFSYKLD